MKIEQEPQKGQLMSHTKPACFNLQDLSKLLRDKEAPRLTPTHCTRAADSTPYLQNKHDIIFFLLPLFIC